jgi:predicted PurR-regulated permease PerM
MGRDSTSRTLFWLTGLAVSAWLLWKLADVLTPFAIAIVLALLLDPLHDRIQARGVPRGLAVGLTFLVFMAVFIGFVAFLIPVTVGQVADLVRNADEYLAKIRLGLDGWVSANGALLQRFNLPPSSTELWTRYQGDATVAVQALLQRFFEFLQASAGKLSWLVIVPLVTLYLLVDLDRARERLIFMLPDDRREQIVALTAKVGGVFAAYVRGLVAICACYGLIVYLALELGFRTPYALILGLAAVALYAVPYLGQLALIASAVIVAWATGHGTGYLVGVGLTLLGIGQLFDQLITPRVIGRQVGLHPVLGLFALMVGGQLFGPFGMVVAVPVAASVRVILVELFPRLTAPIPPALEAKAHIASEVAADAAVQVGAGEEHAAEARPAL